MKTLLVIFTLFQFSVIGQSLFFDDLENSKWISELDIIDISVKHAKEIGLAKIDFQLDELQGDAIIWNFKEGILSITDYNHQLKTENLLETYSYEIDKSKGILKVSSNKKNTITYKVGMTSMANYVILFKTKRR